MNIEPLLFQVRSENVPFFWAGGQISRSKTTLSWENGRSEGITRGRHPWSFGGFRGPQPDGDGSEDCLAILNNVYNVRQIIIIASSDWSIIFLFLFVSGWCQVP